MSIMTFAPASADFPEDAFGINLRYDPAFAAGRADAYDDHKTLSTDELNVRAAWITDLHPDLAYVQGYTAYVKEAQLSDALASGRTDTREKQEQNR